MLLAVSVWAGHFSGMGDATRTFLHWFEALIALPAIAYAGRPFFRSALRALHAGRTNMDVPISLAVILVPGMSLFETIRGGPHAYFDSAVTLLFFLLIGRYLDQRARGSARSAAERLLAMNAGAVSLVLPDGTTRSVRPEQLTAGQEILVATGERVGADGTVGSGAGELDMSLISGETVPQRVGSGDRVFAGTVNLGLPLRIRVQAVGEGTLLAEIVRLMELAEQRRSCFVAIADRVARAYAPVVHSLALLTFLAWMLSGAAPWQTALLYAIAVLIITCPCALGLAVPAVQVLASGRLMRDGTLLKSATALERFAKADMVVFDKTGTLTTGRLSLLPGPAEFDILDAAGMARSSRHPLARALVAAAPQAKAAMGVEEVPGCGLRREMRDGEWRLGRRDWAAGVPEDDSVEAELWLARPGAEPVRLAFADTLRPDAVEVVAELKRRGYRGGTALGRPAAAAGHVAAELGIADWQGGCRPADKAARLEALGGGGPQGSDGRRRAQRRSGAGRRLCLPVAGDRRRHRANSGRCRVPGCPAGARDRGDRRRQAVPSGWSRRTSRSRSATTSWQFPLPSWATSPLWSRRWRCRAARSWSCSTRCAWAGGGTATADTRWRASST